MVRSINYSNEERETTKWRFAGHGQDTETPIFSQFNESLRLRFADTLFNDEFDELNSSDWSYTNATATNSYVTIPQNESIVGTATYMYKNAEFKNVILNGDDSHLGFGDIDPLISFYTTGSKIVGRTLVGATEYITAGNLNYTVGNKYNFKVYWTKIIPTITKAIFFAAEASNDYTKLGELSATDTGSKLYISTASDSFSLDSVNLTYGPILSLKPIVGLTLGTDVLGGASSMLGGGVNSFANQYNNCYTMDSGKNMLRNMIASGSGADYPEWLAIATGTQTLTEDSTTIANIQFAQATQSSSCYNTGEGFIFYQIPAASVYPNVNTIGLFVSSGSGELWSASEFETKNKAVNVEWNYIIPYKLENSV